MTGRPSTAEALSSGAAPAPTISLVLPVFNGEKYLREALDSIFAQNFGDFELIAVDDCSTDATPGILAEYAARHPTMRIVTNAENRKLPASLNAGFSVARGRWYSWTSDDNKLDPDTLARLAEAASTGTADIFYADFRVIDEHGRLITPMSVDEPEDLVLGNAVGCCFLYRREVDAALGGYDEDLFGVEDYDFWLRAARHGFRFQPIREEIYSYRRHAGSLTDTRARQIYALTARIMLPAIEALPPSTRRAHAYLRLACRDPYTLRWNLLWRGFRDDAATILRHGRDIAAWLRFTARVRLS